MLPAIHSIKNIRMTAHGQMVHIIFSAGRAVAVDVFYGLCGGKGEGVWGETDYGVLPVIVVEVFSSERVGAVVEIG